MFCSGESHCEEEAGTDGSKEPGCVHISHVWGVEAMKRQSEDFGRKNPNLKVIQEEHRLIAE